MLWNFPYYVPVMLHCAQLCMLLILLNESEDKYISLNYIYFTAVESTKLYNQHIN